MSWDEKPQGWRDDEWRAGWERSSLKRLLPYVPAYELVREHEDRTLICSFQHHMRAVSGDVYQEIVRRYEFGNPEARRQLLRTIASYLDDNEAGMSVMMLLWDLTGDDPARSAREQVQDTGFVAWDVRAAREAWIRWAEERL